MKRSYNSLTSLTSLTSINSRTKIYNNRDFQKYIENLEEDLIKISNDYYYLKENIYNKINKIIDRYDNKTNKLYIDLRYRENDYIRLNNKIEFIIKDFNKYKIYNYISITNYNLKNTDNIFLCIQIFLYSYTFLIFIILCYQLLPIITNYYIIILFRFFVILYSISFSSPVYPLFK